MIRVNLLPIKKARRRSQGRIQLLLFAGVIVIELAILAAAYFIVNDELSEQEEQVGDLQTVVAELEEDAADVEELQAQAQVYESQLMVLSELEAKRIGPVQMLDEMQAMLSPPRNEEDRVAQLRRDWNVEWDTRRLWVEAFSEGEEGFSLDGYAGNADDVAEFLHRLTTAIYFDGVELDYVERTSEDGADLVSFHIFGNLSYTGFGDDTASDDDS